MAPASTKLYEVLEITNYSITETEIKKAYRKLALIHHPDKVHDKDEKMKAEARFKEIQAAYSILGDPEKRALYDQHGEAYLEGGAGGPGMDGADIFQQFFGGSPFGGMFGGMGGGGGGRQRQQGPPKAKTIHHVHKVTLEHLYNGKTSKMILKAQRVCTGCKGKGGKKVETCRECNGQGAVVKERAIPGFSGMVQRFHMACTKCKGEGKIIEEGSRCQICHGEKTIDKNEQIEVVIPPGAPNGYEIIEREKGDELPGVERGDVVFQIQQKPHDRFVRSGSDLHHKVKLNLVMALAGCQLNIKHLDDRWLTINIKPGEVIAPGTVKAIRDQGMPQMGRGLTGHLYIHFDVEFPEHIGTSPNDSEYLTPDEVKSLEKIFGMQRKEPEKIPADAMTDNEPLDALTEREEAQFQGGSGGGGGGGGGMGAEDEDEDGQGEGVRCQTQ